MTIEQQESRIRVAAESNERHRSRARSVATLCAAAAGALATGLVLTPPATVPRLSQFLGLLTVILLIVGTGFCVSASASTTYESSSSPIRRILPGLAIWRIHTKTLSKHSDAHAKLIEDANRIKKRILINLDLGMWCGGVAALSLVVALSSITLFPSDSATGTISLKTGHTLQSCPSAGTKLKARVSVRDLTNNSSTIAATIRGNQCQHIDEITVYVDKKIIASVRLDKS